MRKFLICIIILIFFTGCKSFKRVNAENQPDECNDFYYVLEYYSVQGGDSAFVGTVYEKCSQARRDKDKAEIKKLKERVNTLCEQLFMEDLEGFKRCIK